MVFCCNFHSAKPHDPEKRLKSIGNFLSRRVSDLGIPGTRSEFRHNKPGLSRPPLPVGLSGRHANAANKDRYNQRWLTNYRTRGDDMSEEATEPRRVPFAEDEGLIRLDIVETERCGL